MSLSSTHLNLINTIDPRIDISKLGSRLYAVENTALKNNYAIFPATNTSNISTITAVCNPPNRGIFISPEFYARVKFKLTFNGTSANNTTTLLQCAGLPAAAGVNPGTAYYDSPRAYGLSGSISNLQVQMNNDNNSTNLNIYYRALTRYLNDIACQDRQSSYTPTMLDQFLQYFDGNGSNRSELRGYKDNVVQCPRGGFIGALVTRNDFSGTAADVATVELELIEPLNISPLAYGCEHSLPPFLQIDTITLTLSLGGRGNSTFGGLISSLWSHSNGYAIPALPPDPAIPAPPQSTFSSTNVELLAADFFFQYFTPPLSMQLPKTIVYNYTSPIYYGNAASSVGAGVTASNLPLQNIQLNSIPQMVYLWVSKRDQDNTMFDTDTYFSISNVNISFNNGTGILATANQNQLYDLSVKNGINMSWRQFTKDVGSVICLKFSEDIPLDSDLLACGSRGSFNFSALITCTNNYRTAVIPTLSALFVNEGVFVISNGQAFREIGLLSENDVLHTKTMTGQPIDQPPAYSALGGLRWSDVVNFFKKAARTALNVAKVAVPALAPQYAQYLPVVDAAASQLGIGGKRRGRPRMSGGKLMSRSAMVDKLR